MRITRTLYPRGLPKLTTSTSIISTNTSSYSSSTSVSTSVSSSISSSTVETPTITPPSSHENPFVLRADNKPNGTVFICVGAIIGFIALLLLGIWIYSTIKRILHAKNNKSLDEFDEKYNSMYYDSISSESSTYSTEPQEKFQNQNRTYPSSNRLSTATNGTNPSFSNFDSVEPNDIIKGRYDDLLLSDNKRNSLFVSPTIEIINLREIEKRKRLSQISDSTDSSKSNNNSLHSLNSPNSSKIFTNQKHKRTRSRLNIVTNSNNSTFIALRSTNGRSGINVQRKTPSMYLDELLQEI